jgi:hypothetical protein
VATTTTHAAVTKKADATAPAPASDPPIVFTVRASPNQLGVANWHLTPDPKTGTLVYDGSDSKGRVKFSTSIRNTKQALHIDSYGTKAGSLVLDLKNEKALAATLDVGQWTTFMGQLTSDWQARPPKPLTEYRNGASWYLQTGALWLDFASRNNQSLALAVDGLAVLSAATGVGTAATPYLLAASTWLQSDSGKQTLANLAESARDLDKTVDAQQALNKDSNEAAAEDQKQQDEKQDAEQDKEEDPQDSAQQDQGQQDPAQQDQGQKDPAQQDQGQKGQQDSTQQDQAQQDQAQQDQQQDAEQDQAGDDGTGVGGDDTGGGGDDDDTGGGGGDDDDTGGGDTEDAVGTCRQHVCPKTTNVCICTHY